MKKYLIAFFYLSLAATLPLGAAANNDDQAITAEDQAETSRITVNQIYNLVADIDNDLAAPAPAEEINPKLTTLMNKVNTLGTIMLDYGNHQQDKRIRESIENIKYYQKETRHELRKGLFPGARQKFLMCSEHTFKLINIYHDDIEPALPEESIMGLFSALYDKVI
ncbi:MAG: hypothetical protein ACQEP8_06765 [Chlamydiota bacterium]